MGSNGGCDEAYEEVGNMYDDGDGCIGRSCGCCAIDGIVLLAFEADVAGV